ncbi:hypothetical protein [Bradyrhizobium sp.]|uniref:hypothetical protein n=1 Tax=Bradyrhizobium sp. TaxID=376 RepID=UPI001EBD1671|nr:hypothetical protein [Bradyrhizobium sp.]MBV8919850.1 hypothetical protein [Bradyrhizobium sp.]MBV9980896.1 hypothetical protein [Bradyrhizobium sp.]
MERLFSILAVGLLLAGQAHATEIWMFAGPHVDHPAPGWERLRTDAGNMWKPDAPWATVASHVSVVQFAPTNVDRATDDDLQQAIKDLKRRNIALAVGTGLLIRSDRCRAKTEAYVGQAALEHMLDKLLRNGADVKYVTMDEPFYYGHRDSSPTACHESAQMLAQALIQSRAIVRKYFPGAKIGSDDVIDASGPWIQELAGWADTYKAVTGEPLAYIHADLDWSEGAVRNLVPLAAVLKQRGVPLGVIYDADRFNNNSDENWSHNTANHFAEVESGLGVHPDHAVIETWVRYPTRMLPESQPGTFTNVVLQYIQRYQKN